MLAVIRKNAASQNAQVVIRLMNVAKLQFLHAMQKSAQIVTRLKVAATKQNKV